MPGEEGKFVSKTISKVGMVIHPVRNMETAAAFYVDGLGLKQIFRDGDRFCAFDAAICGRSASTRSTGPSSRHARPPTA